MSERLKLDREEIGQRLGQVIARKWRTQTEAARELGCSVGALSRYVNGIDLPLWVVVEIARRTDTSLDWILLGRDELAPSVSVPTSTPTAGPTSTNPTTIDTTTAPDIIASINRLDPHELVLVRPTKYGRLERGNILILQVEARSQFGTVFEMVFGRPVFAGRSGLIGIQEPKPEKADGESFRIAIDTGDET